jgi:hypothetical protein
VGEDEKCLERNQMLVMAHRSIHTSGHMYRLDPVRPVSLNVTKSSS